MSRNIFDYLKAVTIDKIDLSKEDDFEKNYNSFMMNRWISMRPETIFFAHFMNKDIDKKTHFLFLLKSLDQESYYFKYLKKSKSEKTDFIQKCYNISEEKAKEFTEILTKKQLTLLKKKYGGKVGK